jgi:hypothetical protein
VEEEQANSPIESEVEVEVENEPQVSEVVARYRDLVASALDLVPELVRGETVEEIDASAVEARRAYTEISKRVAEQYWVGVSVSAGNPARSAQVSYAETLKPEAKIALGLRGM